VTQDPMAGMLPDSRRLLRNLLGYDAVGKRFKHYEEGTERFYLDEREQPAGRHCEGVQVGPSRLSARSGTSVKCEEEGARAQKTDQAVSDVGKVPGRAVSYGCTCCNGMPSNDGKVRIV
jgi:hypothetical protein